MPELPEVETVVRTLRPRLVGAVIERVWSSGLRLRMARAVNMRELARRCRNARVLGVERRGKYILMHLQPEAWLLVHLGMSGRLRLHEAHGAGQARAPHTHVEWALRGGRVLRFVDPRRFGLVRVTGARDDLGELGRLGPDPLAELDEAGLARELGTSRAPLKAFLLDQRRVAGLGNIYVCETLHRARIHPATPARRARGKAGALLAAIRVTIESAIDNRGTTLRDFVDGDGGEGGHFEHLRVYGREGRPCPVCGTPIKRRVDSGRSTFFCPVCQKR